MQNPVNNTSTPNLSDELNKRYKATATILFAEIGATIAFSITAWFVAGEFQPFGETAGNAGFTLDNLTKAPTGSGVNLAITILWMAILVIAIGTFLMRRVLFASAGLRDAFNAKGSLGVLQSLQTKTTFMAILGGLVAVIGFTISILSGNKYDMLRAAVVALVILAMNFPRRSSWQKVSKIQNENFKL